MPCASLHGVHGLSQAALKAPHLVPMEQPNLEVSNFEDLQVGWLVSQFWQMPELTIAHLAVRVADVLVELPFSHCQVGAYCAKVIIDFLQTVAVLSRLFCTPSHPLAGHQLGLPQLAFVTILPVQRVWWILPGTSSFLNCSGRSVARWGMCRSPMQSTSTMS